MSALDSVTGSFVEGDTRTPPAEQYTYDNLVPSGVNLGSLGGIMSTESPNSWGNLLQSLISKATTPAGAAALATGLAGLLGANKPNASPGWRGKINPNKYTFTQRRIAQPEYVSYSRKPVMGRQNFEAPTYTQKAAEGGIIQLMHGGEAKSPRYLSGHTDGMADKLSTSIDGEQPAALSHGEFVIPADVVSHLGNGNSEAGARELYKMMDRVREARTGTKKQGKRINPEKFTPGGIADYAGGGVVSFADGGTTTGQGVATSMPVTSESNLSEWAAPGVVDYIEKGTALANQPYQAYTGPLTAGASPLQQKAFDTAANLQVPTSFGIGSGMVQSAGEKLGSAKYSPSQMTINKFDTNAVKQYMNPYVDLALEPQLAAARRQSQITQMGNAAKAVQAGAFGGNRNAVMDAETQRTLADQLANITGQGYNTAYDKALAAFNTQQNLGLQVQQANEASKQFGANYGLDALKSQIGAGTALGGLGIQQGQMGLANLQQQAALGAAERGIEQEGLDALYKQYEQERLDPYKQIQFQQSLYSGLPVSTVTGSTATSPIQNFNAGIAGMGSAYDAINKLLGGK